MTIPLVHFRVLLKTLAATEILAQNGGMKKVTAPPTNLTADVNGSTAIQELFDQIPDTVFFTKDAAGRYVLVNQTLLKRLGKSHRSDLIGHSASELFPPRLARRIEAQDYEVTKLGKSIHGELELHLYPDGHQDWCLTWKQPVRDNNGKIVGLSGISRDLNAMPSLQPGMVGLTRAFDLIRKNLDRALPLSEVAKRAGLSTYQFDRRIRSLFGVSAGQYIARARVERACHRLRQTPEKISMIGLECGYADQAAFGRQFKKYVGMTPKAYRDEVGRAITGAK